MLMNVDGILIENMDGFFISYEKEVKENNCLYVFVCEVDGEIKYVVLVYGVGFWGVIWGYVVLNVDKDIVYGVYFLYVSEILGLGVEIVGVVFQNEFFGKKVLKDGQVVLVVEKNGKVIDFVYQVDGILGGIIILKGVDVMIKVCLSQYDKFLINN